MATALGCSPQFADFKHIVQAVGHYVLQHLIVLWRYASLDTIIDRLRHCTPHRPDLIQDSISSPPHMNSKNYLIGGQFEAEHEADHSQLECRATYLSNR